MDTYFQRKHHLPNEIARLIFQFATMRRDINRVRLQPVSRFPPAYNTTFFTTWRYIEDQVNETGTLMLYDRRSRLRLMFIMF